MSEISSLPELMRFADGSPVETPEQWAERRKEILTLFERSMYGKMPDPLQEKVSYAIAPGTEAQTREMKITVSHEGREGFFTVRVTLPEEPVSGMACYIEYCPFSWYKISSAAAFPANSIRRLPMLMSTSKMFLIFGVLFDIVQPPYTVIHHLALDNMITFSIPEVQQNISTGWTFLIAYPASRKRAASRAWVATLQDT